MTSEDRKRLSEIGYQVIDAKNEHVEKGWIVRVPNDDKRVLIAASEGDAWDAARDHHASMTNEVTQAALESCPNPWCNSRKTVDCEIRAAEAPILMPSRSSAEWAVACPVCPLQTPYFDTEAEAIAAWNTRLTAKSGEQQSCEPIATVEMIETVTGDFYTEPGEPIWRVMVGEYCADFDSEQAARNFASAINLAAQSGEGRALPWLSKLLRYHETGGHEGDGSDHAMRNARTELDAIVSGEGRSGAGEDALLAHFTRMMEAAANYVEPTTYVARHPNVDALGACKYNTEFPEPDESHAEKAKQEIRQRRDQAFIRDMLYMLDGPEQRAALNARQSGEGGNTLQHVAYYDEGAFHWMSGIAPRNCELYAAWPAALRATDDAGGA